MRILAIDDEPCLLRLYPRALRSHEVVALGPDEALQRVARDAAFDLVLCDLNLGKTAEGWFHERLIALAPGLDGRMIFCTGGGCDAEGWRILEAVADRVLYKPFDAPQLRAIVDRFGSERVRRAG